MNFGKFVLASALVAVLGTAAQAQGTGSMTLSGTTATLNGGSDLATVTSLNLNSFAGTNSIQSGGTSGIYTGIPLGTAFTTSTLTLADLPAFSFTNATYGTFQAVASLEGFTSHIVTQSAGFLDIFLIGNFSGLPGSPASSPTSVEFSFTKAGMLVSVSGSLNTPPAAVPEPASAALVGLGLLGAGLGRRTLRARSAR